MDEILDVVSRAGATGGLLALLVYAFFQVRDRDEDWKNLLDAKDAEIARLHAELDRLRRLPPGSKNDPDR